MCLISKHCKPATETCKTVSSHKKWLQTVSDSVELSVSNIEPVVTLAKTSSRDSAQEIGHPACYLQHLHLAVGPQLQANSMIRPNSLDLHSMHSPMTLKKTNKFRSTLQLLSKRRHHEAEYMTLGLCFWAVVTLTLEQGNTPWVFTPCPMNPP